MVPRWTRTRGPLEVLPETYVGHHKAEQLAVSWRRRGERASLYAAPPRLRLNQWALSGEWTVKAEATMGKRFAQADPSFTDLWCRMAAT